LDKSFDVARMRLEELRALNAHFVSAERGTVPVMHGDDQAHPPHRDPIAEFKRLATAAGVIRGGDPLDRTQIDFAFAVVEACASIADPFGHSEGCGAEAIRAELGDHH
jgi:hypothetical protein